MATYLQLLEEGQDPINAEDSAQAPAAAEPAASPAAGRKPAQTMAQVVGDEPDYDLEDSQKRGISKLAFGMALQGHDGMTGALALATRISEARKQAKAAADTKGFLTDFVERQSEITDPARGAAVMRELLAAHPRVTGETFAEVLGAVDQRRQKQVAEDHTNKLFLTVRANKGKVSDEQLSEALQLYPKADIGAAMERYQKTRNPEDKVAEEAMTLEARAKMQLEEAKRKKAAEDAYAEQQAAEVLKARRGIQEAEKPGLDLNFSELIDGQANMPKSIEPVTRTNDGRGETYASFFGEGENAPTMVPGRSMDELAPEDVGTGAVPFTQARNELAAEGVKKSKAARDRASVEFQAEVNKLGPIETIDLAALGALAEKYQDDLDPKVYANVWKLIATEKGKDRRQDAGQAWKAGDREDRQAHASGENEKGRGLTRDEGEKARAAAAERDAAKAADRDRADAQKLFDELRKTYAAGVPPELAPTYLKMVKGLKARGAK